MHTDRLRNANSGGYKLTVARITDRPPQPQNIDLFEILIATCVTSGLRLSSSRRGWTTLLPMPKFLRSYGMYFGRGTGGRRR
jgi:hypothetical protein